MWWLKPKCKRCGKRHDRWTEICWSCEHEIANFVLGMTGTVLALRIRGNKEEGYQDAVDVVSAELRFLRASGVSCVRVDELEQTFLTALNIPLAKGE